MKLNESKCNFLIPGNKCEHIFVNAGTLTIPARMSNMLSFPKMKLLIKSFFESQFAYCPLVWMLYNRSLNNKINKLYERALRILHKDDCSTFGQLLAKEGQCMIEIYRSWQ